MTLGLGHIVCSLTTVTVENSKIIAQIPCSGPHLCKPFQKEVALKYVTRKRNHCLGCVRFAISKIATEYFKISNRESGTGNGERGISKIRKL